MSAPPPAPKSDPWRKETAWNYSGCSVYLLFLCAYVFYYYVRIRYTLHGGLLAYAVVILIFEFISSSSMVVHGLSLLRRRCGPYCLSKSLLLLTCCMLASHVAGSALHVQQNAACSRQKVAICMSIVTPELLSVQLDMLSC